ncbi:MerR family transcriptional regulator [Sphingomonas ginkgonis]|uniref:Mercuric resistance operon regulatory protein n=1 Tax=Sphingomonas ginkgonis TaxID=2315330 RepID=A0A429V9V6_9SPHN|nr:MerR family transcriptional regulator [Sphingomonas ginkgonis]RST30705.1 MerR family transcriptional regulator [Sphingomonas ginkgonis]
MASLTIARLADSAGVGVETIRYYQRRGLIDTPERPAGFGSAGGIRRYDEADVRRLRFIRSAQAAGFTLEEIGRLLELDRTDDRATIRELTEQRIAALDVKIEELRQARASLARLAGECGSGTGGPCPIIEAFDEGPLPG